MPSKKNILASACVILFKLFVAGWGVEWIRITISTGEIFSCPLKKKKRWLKNGEGNSRTVICKRSGNYKTVKINFHYFEFKIRNNSQFELDISKSTLIRLIWPIKNLDQAEDDEEQRKVDNLRSRPRI